MKKLVLFFALMASVVYGYGVCDTSEAQKDLRDIRSELPTVLDEENGLVLTDVSCYGNEMRAKVVFSNPIDGLMGAIGFGMVDAMGIQDDALMFFGGICSSPEFYEIFREYPDFKIVGEYYMPGGKLIKRVTVTKDSCDRFLG